MSSSSATGDSPVTIASSPPSVSPSAVTVASSSMRAITISSMSDQEIGHAMAAVEEEQDTIQEISSQGSDNFELLEAEEIAAVRAAEAAEARVRVLRARASSSRGSARSSASRSSGRTVSVVADTAAGPMRVPAPPCIVEEVIEVNIGTPELPIAVPREDRVLPPGVPAGAAAEYFDASENVGNMQRARAFWLARDRALAAEQQPDQGGSVRSPAHSERSALHHHVQELEARIKALQESKPDPVSVVRPPSAGSFASATSAAPREFNPVQRRPAVEDPVREVPEVVPPPGLPAPLQDYDDYNNIIFDNTSFISLTMTAVRDHDAPGIREPPGDLPSSSNSSTSSSSSSRHKKNKVKKKKKITIPYKVKSGDIKLPSWPTTTAFPAWRRTLRQAVISASDRPERARPWISAVESDDIIMEDLACADGDRHRTLDAKLAEALTKILKGKPARKMALAAERAALSHDMLSGRQCE